MPQSSKVFSRPSLERIQNLEKEFPNFNDQLNQVEKIAHYNTSDKDLSVFAGRAEWALRWTLKQAQNQAPNARVESFIKVWSLLSKLISNVPSDAAIARLIKSHDFLASVEKVLVSVSGCEISGYSRTTSDNGGHADATDSSESPFKRKRDLEVEDFSKRRKSDDGVALLDQTYTSTLDLFLCVSRCLHSLFVRAKLAERQQTLLNKDILRPSLRTDCRGAASVLRAGLKAVNTLQSFAIPGQNQVGCEEASCLITHLLWMWEHRIVSGHSVEIISAECFSKECLIPAVEYLAHLSDLASIEDQTISSETSFSRHSVQQLIARNILLPAKRAFARSEEEETSHSAEEKSVPKSLSLQNLFEPFENSSIEGQNLKGIRKALPSVFRLAIDCCSTSGRHRTTSELQWYESLFRRLTQCLGLDISENKTTTKVADYQLDTISRILRLCQVENIKLSTSVLKSIASNYISLESSNIIEVQCSIISSILSMRPEIYVGDHLNANDASRILREELLADITTICWISGKGLPINSAEFYSTYSAIRDDVLMPLMDAYVAQRNFYGLVDLMYEQLIKVTESKRRQVAHDQFRTSIWDDADVMAIFALHLEQHAPVQIIKDAFTRIQRRINDSMHEKAGSFVTAGMLVLINLCHTIREAAVGYQLAPQLLSSMLTTTEVLETFTTDDEMDHIIRGTCWQLFTELCGTWASITDSETFARHFVLDSPHLWDLIAKCLDLRYNMTNSRHSSHRERLECLSLMVGILTILGARHYPNDSQDFAFSKSRTYLLPSLNPMNPSYDITDSYLVASSVVRSPSSFRDPLIRKAVLGQLFQNAQDALVIWQELVLETCHCEDLRADMFEFLARHDLYRDFFIEKGFYQQISSACIPRKHREAVLDDVVLRMLRGNSTTIIELVHMLSLIIHLVKEPHGNALLSKTPQYLWQLAIALDRIIKAQEQPEKTIYSILNTLPGIFKTILHFVAPMQERIASHKALLETAMSKHLTDSTSIGTYPATLSLVSHGLAMLGSRPGQDALDARIPASARQQFSQSITNEFKRLSCLLVESSTEGHERDLLYFIVMLGLCDITLLRHCYPDLQTCLESLRSFRSSKSLEKSLLIFELKVIPFELRQRDLGLPVNTLAMMSSAKDYGVVQCSITTTYDVNCTLQCEQLVKDITYDTGSNVSLIDRLKVLRVLMIGRKDWTLSPKVSELVTVLCLNIPRSKSLRTFMIMANTVIDVLNQIRQGHHITQFAIEAVMFLVTTMTTSPSSTALSGLHSSKVYGRLCRMVHAILALHRFSLRGRFDLLLQALRGLFCSVFDLNKRSSNVTANVTTVTTRPPVKPSSELSKAAHISRLLSLLAEPSTSSVSRSRNPSSNGEGKTRNSALTDEVARSRVYAGQFAPILLMVYCDCMLISPLKEESRTHLLPGIWSLLGLLGGNGRQSLSERMTASNRTVFKSLVAEWRVQGRKDRK